MTTEEKILVAAREEFQQAGFGGARMQKIADRAGINKASLHYYYRNKEKLFQQVLQKDILRLMIPVSMVLRDPSLSLEQRIRTFVKTTTQLFMDQPNLLLFIMQELNRAPERLLNLVRDILKEHGLNDDESRTFRGQLEEGVKNGTLKPVDPEQYIASVLGMCMFPYAARSLVMELLEKDKEAYQNFLEQRQEELITLCRRMIFRSDEPED
ncbi:TetR family transcriptional regulator [Balneolaceae bacterium ANBcel3]|nr:TetR family transcriptional regulator [Balneolaceae bacterium ANBcel3]